MKKWAQKQAGFTIVELLIVIVVIAILATITIVSYNGIQQRAQNVQTTSAVRDWIQGLISYATVHGDYPYTGDRTQTPPYADDEATIADNFPCLGEYPDGVCASVNNVNTFGAGWAVVNDDWNAIMKDQFGGKLPQPSQKNIVINGQPHRGAFLNIVGYATKPTRTGTGPGLTYFLTGKDTECIRVGGGISYTRTQGDNGVKCSVSLPNFR